MTQTMLSLIKNVWYLVKSGCAVSLKIFGRVSLSFQSRANLPRYVELFDDNRMANISPFPARRLINMWLLGMTVLALLG